MGLSSSQARLLNLTSRMHQIEYKAAKLEAEKLQMANESDRVYNEYLDALEKTKVQHKQLKSDGSVTYVDFTDYNDFIKAGFAIDYKNTVYTDWNTLCTAAGLDNSTTNFETKLTNLINSGEATIVQGSTTAPPTADASLYTSVTISSKTYYFAKDPQTASPAISNKAFVDAQTSISTNTSLQEVKDESELRKAEAKYEADMRKIDNKERKYDADLATFDNERNAIKQEMDTLKTVAKDNVDRTFKIFS